MLFYEEVSQLLFENSNNVKEGEYITLMNLLKDNYKDQANFSFARYVLQNERLFDPELTKKVYNLIEKEFDNFEIQINQEKEKIKKQINILNKEQDNKNFYSDLKMMFTLAPVQIILTYYFFTLLI